MTLRPEGYRDRLVDPLIAQMLKSMGAVQVAGPKWCGKTWTVLNHSESVFYVADPKAGFRNRSMSEADPSVALVGERPHAIDEWQDVPGIWDAVRFEVDRTGGRGHFLLTGSAMPPETATSHSGVGRIASIRMRPMTLLETGVAAGGAAISKIAQGQEIAVNPGNLTLADIANSLVRGGWPAGIDADDEAAQIIAASYLDGLIHQDMSRLDGVRRDSNRVEALIGSLARTTATVASLATIRSDIQQHADLGLSDTTVREYLSALSRLYVVEEIPAWDPALRSPVRLRGAPKRMLVDPSLACAALGATPDALLSEPKTMGFLFESMVLRDLSVFAGQLRGRLFHYRDASGLECDAIIALPQFKWIPIEIKLGHTQVDKAAQNLLRLAKKMKAGGQPEPVAMICVVGTGSFAHTREDGVTVIPIDLLEP